MEQLYYFFLGVWVGLIIIEISLSANKKDEVDEKPESPYVFCEDCKYLIRKDNAQVVETETSNDYYCPAHRKPYDREDGLVGFIDNKTGEVVMSRRYFKSNVEVDKNGKVIE